MVGRISLQRNRYENTTRYAKTYKICKNTFVMDKNLLVIEIKKVIDSFKEQSKTFDFVGLESTYGTDDSFILHLKAEWLDNFSSRYDAIELIVKKLFEMLDKTYLRAINRVHILDKTEKLPYYSIDLIIEKSDNYKLAA